MLTIYVIKDIRNFWSGVVDTDLMSVLIRVQLTSITIIFIPLIVIIDTIMLPMELIALLIYKRMTNRR